MAIGDCYKGNLTLWKDKEYGYTIIRPVQQDGNRAMYFTSNCFTNSNTDMIISCIRNGNENFYLLNFLTGEYMQLTDENGIAANMAYFDKNRDTLYYTNKYVIKSVNIRDLISKTVYESEVELGTMAVTCDGKYLISSSKQPLILKNNDEQDVLITLDRMFRIDLHWGEYNIIMHRSFPIDHIQCNPEHPEQVMYCAWGYLCTHHRIWHTNLEGTLGGALGPEQPNEHRVHEYFTPDGSKIAYHGKFFSVSQKAEFTNIGHTWGIMNKDGSEDKYYLCEGRRQAGHSSISFNGKLVVADGDGDISLMEFDDIKMEAFFKPIFRHNSSMKGNFVHPHPAFSCDDRFIVFGTDFGDKKSSGNIYLIDLHSK